MPKMLCLRNNLCHAFEKVIGDVGDRICDLLIEASKLLSTSLNVEFSASLSSPKQNSPLALFASQHIGKFDKSRHRGLHDHRR